jgi:hypothetical protein
MNVQVGPELALKLQVSTLFQLLLDFAFKLQVSTLFQPLLDFAFKLQVSTLFQLVPEAGTTELEQKSATSMKATKDTLLAFMVSPLSCRLGVFIASVNLIV